MDRILIEDLELIARVGVPDTERARPQKLRLCVELELPLEPAAASDDLARTIDYGKLSRRLVGFAAEGEWKLIETLAERLARVVLEEFNPAAVTLTLKKYILPNARWVAVQIRRER
ncbi:MAG: dihydroneopterin aldolase [Verrucomicrobia bacterium]|nr:dihydroneopterin aldolase [Verrucomicrobiota bacterium]